MDDNLRISDREREEAANQLREHAAAGRLTLDELTGRLEAVLSARTGGELAASFADLPRADHGRERRRHAKQHGMRIHTRVYLWVSLGMILLWALTGFGYFWPIWPILGWGIGVFSHVSAVRSATGSRPVLRAPGSS